MKRYLIFDSYCSACSSLAHTIEELAAGKLKAVSIASEQAKGILDQVFPNGWEHQPYFVTVKQDKISVSTGYKIALQLAMLLGFKKGLQVYNLAKQYGVKIPFGRKSFSSGKRKFIRNAAIFTGTLFCVGSGFPNFKALVAQETNNNESESNLSILEPEEAGRFRTVITESKDYEEFKTQLKPGFVEEEVIAIRKGSGEIFISIPITYLGQSQPSNFTKIIDQSQSVLGSTAFSFEDTPNGTQGRFWHNGKLMANITVNDQGTVTYGWVFDEKWAGSNLIGNNFVAQGKKSANKFIEQISNQDSKQGKTNSFLDSSKANALSLSCLNSCLSNLGLPTTLLGLIGVGCAFACGATFGLGCAACLGFVLGGYGGIIKVCVKRC